MFVTRSRFVSRLFLIVAVLIIISIFSIIIISNTLIEGDDAIEHPPILHVKTEPTHISNEKETGSSNDITDIPTVKTEPITSYHNYQNQSLLDKFVKIPNVVAYDSPNEDPIVLQRRNQIREGFVHAYSGYEKHCKGKSEFKPISRNCHNWMFKELPLTTIDSLDTILIMGLHDIYERAFTDLKQNLDWNKDISVSVFEATIRFVGGLLTVYQMTEEPFYLDMVQKLTEKLLPAFDTHTGIPRSLVNLKSGMVSEPGWMSGSAVLSEIGTLQLEFTTLSYHTKDVKYKDKVLKVYHELKKIKPADGLFPCYISPDNGQSRPSPISMGGLGDSFYEYLLKFWLLLEKSDSDMKNWYYETAESIIKNLAVKIEDDMWFFAERNQIGSGLYYKMDHLACFGGGMLALGAQHTDEQTKKRHMEVAEGIGKFCFEMYNRTKLGLPGEHVLVNYVPGQKTTWSVGNGAARSWLMRPEAVETWFILWRLTKKQQYRDYGWKYFEAINKYSRVESGYTGIVDVEVQPPQPDDVQQSYFLAETLKYLFLLFCPDDVLPLDKFIFNTEAHPLLGYKGLITTGAYN